ncbi:MAG: YkgJ family cysteine cluster protein [Candidatus Hodarchaeales archaeon]
MIRGFSELSGINCLECHYKCCASEYKLPLTTKEEKYIRHKFPSYRLFLEKHEGKQFLLRGNKCPFLTNTGLCELHQTEYKPLVCQTYPLIFWKYNPNEVLVWLNPCRGDGFRWIIEKELRFSNKEIEDTIIKINDKYNVYWGEEIDHTNPYEGIRKKRLEQERELNLSEKEPSLLDQFLQIDFPKEYTTLIAQLQKTEETYQLSYQTKNFDRIINAVLKWLCWSPVGLNLSFLNSKLIFTISALWIKSEINTLHESGKEILLDDKIQNNIGFFLAQSILPDFWIHLGLRAKEKEVKKFSLKVQRILKGEISQQNLITE